MSPAMGSSSDLGRSPCSGNESAKLVGTKWSGEIEPPLIGRGCSMPGGKPTRNQLLKVINNPYCVIGYLGVDP